MWQLVSCAGLKRATQSFQTYLYCSKSEGNIGRMLEQEERLSINQSLFSIQTNNNNNIIHTFVNMDTERAGNELILLI